MQSLKAKVKKVKYNSVKVVKIESDDGLLDLDILKPSFTVHFDENPGWNCGDIIELRGEKVGTV